MANITRYEPFRSYLWRNAFDQFFSNDWPTSFLGWDRPARQMIATPPANLYETEDAFKVVVSLPGVDPSALNVTVKQQVLTISGQRTLPMPENANPIWKGISEGEFQYSFTLPTAVEADDVEARYEHGLLLLNLPKIEQVRARKIAVTVGSPNAQLQAKE